MPSIPFVDNELIEETKKRTRETTNDVDYLEEHQFIANCLRIGFSINDLKELEYKDVAKIMLCWIENKDKKTKKATQSDWDRLAGRR